MQRQGSDYFNLAQQAQKEGRWQDAVVHLEEGDRNGCGMCMWWLAECYSMEYWGKQDTPVVLESDTFRLKAAQQGNERAIFDLREYGELEPPSPSDPYVLGMYNMGNMEIANRYFEQCTDTFAKRRMFRRIPYHLQTERLSKLRKLAEEGNPLDQYLLARELDSSESLYWFRRAADQVHVNSMGNLYEHFMTKETNYAKAAYWYKQLPKNNHHYTKTFLYNQENLFDGIGKCQKACYQVILIRKYRQSILSWIPKDVVVMIAKILWGTYEDVCWQERRSKRLKSKKKIKYF